MCVCTWRYGLGNPRYFLLTVSLLSVLLVPIIHVRARARAPLPLFRLSLFHPIRLIASFLPPSLPILRLLFASPRSSLWLLRLRRTALPRASQRLKSSRLRVVGISRRPVHFSRMISSGENKHAPTDTRALLSRRFSRRPLNALESESRQ